MNTVNFLGLLLCAAVIAFNAFAQTPIEVFINGVRFESIEAYKDSKVKHVNGGASTKEDEQALKIAVSPITEDTSNQLQAIGQERGVARTMVDFKQDLDNPMLKFSIMPTQLEQQMDALMDGRTEPLLIIANKNRLRVMALKQALISEQNLRTE